MVSGQSLSQAACSPKYSLNKSLKVNRYERDVLEVENLFEFAGNVTSKSPEWHTKQTTQLPTGPIFTSIFTS